MRNIKPVKSTPANVTLSMVTIESEFYFMGTKIFPLFFTDWAPIDHFYFSKIFPFLSETSNGRITFSVALWDFQYENLNNEETIF